MKTGPYSAEVVAVLLGKKPQEVRAMASAGDLPGVLVDGSATVGRYKFYASQLLVWFNKRSSQAWMLEELERELELAASKLKQTKERKRKVLA